MQTCISNYLSETKKNKQYIIHHYQNTSRNNHPMKTFFTAYFSDVICHSIVVKWPLAIHLHIHHAAVAFRRALSKSPRSTEDAIGRPVCIVNGSRIGQFTLLNKSPHLFDLSSIININLKQTRVRYRFFSYYIEVFQKNYE